MSNFDGEILDMNMYRPETGGLNTLAWVSNREMLRHPVPGRNEIGSLRFVRELELARVSAPAEGQPGWEVYYKEGVQAQNWFMDSTEVDVGFALQRGLDERGRNVYPAIIARISQDGFNQTDFSRGVESIEEICLSTRNLETYRGVVGFRFAFMAGMMAGSAIGGAVGYMAGDLEGVKLGLPAGAAVGAIAAMGASLIDNALDQRKVERDIPGIGQYFANNQAYDALNQLVTHNDLFRIESEVYPSVQEALERNGERGLDPGDFLDFYIKADRLTKGRLSARRLREISQTKNPGDYPTPIPEIGTILITRAILYTRHNRGFRGRLEELEQLAG